MINTERLKEEIEFIKENYNREFVESDERFDKETIYVDGKQIKTYHYLAMKYWPQYFENGRIKDSYLVHHLDFNHSNNIASNLVVLTFAEHNIVHSLFDPSRDEWKSKISSSMQGKNTYKRNDITRDKMRKSKLGKRFITNGKENKLVEITDNYIIPDGWRLGCTQNHKKERGPYKKRSKQRKDKGIKRGPRKKERSDKGIKRGPYKKS